MIIFSYDMDESHEELNSLNVLCMQHITRLHLNDICG